MEAMRQSWTDDRLDDFRAETARRFDAVDKRFDKGEGGIKDLRTEMNGRFDQINGRFEAMNGRIDDMNGRFDAMNGRFDAINARFDAVTARLESMQRVMLQFSGALLVALIGFMITQA
jgi:chromosome segregation ATPase